MHATTAIPETTRRFMTGEPSISRIDATPTVAMMEPALLKIQTNAILG